MDDVKPVVWMKEKHRQLKTVGRHKSTGGASKKRERRSASIKTEHAVRTTEHVMVLDFKNGRKGKISWQVREKSGK